MNLFLKKKQKQKQKHYEFLFVDSHRRHAGMHARAAAATALTSLQPHAALSMLLAAAAAAQAPIELSNLTLSSSSSSSSTSSSVVTTSTRGRRRRPVGSVDNAPLSGAALASARVTLRWTPMQSRLSTVPRFGWLAVQRAVLADLYNTARHSNATRVGAAATAAQLLRVAPTLPATTQTKLLEAMRALAESTHSPVRGEEARTDAYCLFFFVTIILKKILLRDEARAPLSAPCNVVVLVYPGLKAAARS